ncbi:MAG: hypothetical protein GY861_12835 [bacterium]|nr:hypothetical protein [bacterium]
MLEDDIVFLEKWSKVLSTNQKVSDTWNCIKTALEESQKTPKLPTLEECVTHYLCEMGSQVTLNEKAGIIVTHKFIAGEIGRGCSTHGNKKRS